MLCQTVLQGWVRCCDLYELIRAFKGASSVSLFFVVKKLISDKRTHLIDKELESDCCLRKTLVN